MKRILVLLLLSCSFWSSYAQEKFTLSLELVNPSGKLDQESYFLARLKNNNDTLSYWVFYGGEISNGIFPWASYFKVVFDKGTSEYMSNPKPFFDYRDKRYVLIAPVSEYQTKLLLFETVDAMGYNGIFPLAEGVLPQFRRVRIKLENFDILPMMRGSLDRKHLYARKSIDLYSNWVNIDAPKLVTLLRKHLGKE